MTITGWMQIALFSVIIILITRPLGGYMTRVFAGERTFLSPIFRPVERAVYWCCGVDEKEEQHWLTYAVALLFFSVAGFVTLYALQRLQGVQGHKAGDAEKQQRDGIGQPVLLLLLVDAAAPVDGSFDRAENRTQERPLAGEDARHVAAEGPGEQDHDHTEQRDLDPSADGHRKLLEPLGVDQRVDEIDHDDDGHDRAEDIVEQHFTFFHRRGRRALRRRKRRRRARS